MGWVTNELDRNLPQSLCVLARLGLRNAQADGFAIDRLTRRGEAWERVSWEGMTVPSTAVDGVSVIRFPLRSEGAQTGVLSFAFKAAEVSSEARRVLDQIALASQGVWRIWHAHASWARDSLRIAELAAELADSKITDRALAFLEMGAEHPNPADAISRSATAIVRAYQLRPIPFAQKLEREAAEYALIRRAKGFLQARLSLTEAQAYLHLRRISRQTRRPLSEIASDVIELGFASRQRDRDGKRQQERKVIEGPAPFAG